MPNGPTPEQIPPPVGDPPPFKPEPMPEPKPVPGPTPIQDPQATRPGLERSRTTRPDLTWLATRLFMLPT